jgi:hypothetical protein
MITEKMKGREGEGGALCPMPDLPERDSWKPLAWEWYKFVIFEWIFHGVEERSA